MQSYTHSVVELECLIKTKTNSKKDKKIKIKLPSKDDWDKNLQSILKRIPKKFKVIKTMKDNEWCLKIKNTNKIIDDKNNGAQIGKLLSTIKPTVIIQIIDAINTMTDDLINDMSLNEIQDLQSTLDDTKKSKTKSQTTKNTLTQPQLPSHMKRTQSSRTVRIGASKPKVYIFEKNAYGTRGRRIKKTPKSLKKKKKANELEEIKEDEDGDGKDDDEKGKGDKKEKGEPVNISLLLNDKQFFIFESNNLQQQLVELGTYIAVLPDDKKKQLKNTLGNMLDKAIKGLDNSKQIFQMLIGNMIKMQDSEYVGGTFKFLSLLGYSVEKGEDNMSVILSGEPKQDILENIQSDFYHLSNAMQKPRPNIYEQLKIEIPEMNDISRHESGINCNEFIIFELNEILLENQQSSLVDKSVLDPVKLERFMNFLAPGASKYECKEIYFAKLKKLNIYSIGLFGSKQEILALLLGKFKSISKGLYDVILNDDDAQFLRPGIHAILPVDLQRNNGENVKNWDKIVYLFYISMNRSFDMNKMKAVKYMRKDPSCLLSRVLWEMSNTVCIQVSSDELKSFGTMQVEQEPEEKKEEKTSGGKKKKKARRRQKLKFSVEETEDNYIMATGDDTKSIKISVKSDDGRNEWKKFGIGSRIDVYSENGWFTAKIMGIKLKSIEIHYIGFSSEYDEWLSIEEKGIYCDCDNLCENDKHLMSKQRTQVRYQEVAERNDGKIDYQFVSKRKIDEIAQDSYLFGGNSLNGYIQLFKVAEREGRNQIDKKFTKRKDLVAFFKELNKNNIIQWTYEFGRSFGIRTLAQCVLGSKQYNDFKLEMRRLSENEKNALTPKGVKQEVDRIIEQRNNEMLFEFDKFYKGKYCKKVHKQISDIIAELGDYIDESNAEAVEYAKLVAEKKEDDEDEDAEDTWRDFLFANIDKAMKKVMTDYNNELLNIKEETRKGMVACESADDKDDAVTKVKYEEEIDIREQQNKSIEKWFDCYTESLRDYKSDIYGYSNILNFKMTKRQVERDISNSYDEERQLLVEKIAGKVAAIQDKKDSSKFRSIMLSKYKYTKSILLSKAKEEFFYITYFIPTVVPPSLYLQFVTIDLPDYEQEIRTNIMRNMQYEIAQTDKIIFSEMMSNGESIMFIRSENEETKQSETKIIASSSRILTFESRPLKVLKKKKVIMVSYCESQKIFAILFEGQLAFCVFQDGGRISFTNKMCDLQDLNWYNKGLKLRALLMDEVNKNLFVYLIDEYNNCRCYDYDANSWDTAKKFEIDRAYNRYLIPPTGAFLLCIKPEYTTDGSAYTTQSVSGYRNESKTDEEKQSAIEGAKLDLLSNKTCNNSIKLKNPRIFVDGGYKSVFGFTDTSNQEWSLICYVSSNQELIRIVIGHKDTKKNADTIEIEFQHWGKLYKKIKIEKLKDVKTPTGRIQIHAYLLSERRKLHHRISDKSLTGYEGKDNKTDTVDSVLLPGTFSINNMDLDRIKFQEIKKGQLTVCGIDSNNEFFYHLLDVQVSEARMKIQHHKKINAKRKITKLDYMEYMIEKFGSRAAVHYPMDAILALHTTFILKDADCSNIQELGNNIASRICKSLIEKESKDFKYFNWQCNALKSNDKTTTALGILSAITNKPSSFGGDEYIRNMITQLPIQIARGANNKFQLQYNGSDDQTSYIKASDPYELCGAIRFGAYDGLIKSWEGKIKIVTSMGKQSTGKSYMLNHLFGTKFDISGGRCTDGSWMSCKIIQDCLYIICDFEGLGSFERSAQEDMLLATFNSAISNCTIFKCDNRFDRTVEDMFNKFQSGVKIMSGSQLCFQGELLLVIKDVVETGAEAAVADFNRHIERLAQESDVILNDKGKKESSFFVTQMYKNGLSLIPYPPLANDSFFSEMQLTLKPAFDDIQVLHVGGKQFLDFVKLIMAKLNIGDWSAMSGEQAKIRANEIRGNLQNAVEAGSIIQPKSTEYGVTFEVDDDQNLLLLDGNKVIEIDLKSDVIPQIKQYKEVIDEYSDIDGKVEDKFVAIIDGLSDAGLILGKAESLKFLWGQFSAKIKRKHQNHKSLTNLYQLFLDIIVIRRKVRVTRYIIDNTFKFGDADETDSLRESADSRLNIIRDKMKLCRAKCKNCFFMCLLCKNHEDDEEERNDHSCNNAGSHGCRERCTYCFNETGHKITCGDKCGHSGKHNCRKQNHACGKTCSLSKYGGCQVYCNLKFGHNKAKQKCKCAAETHFCPDKCAIPMCKNTCKMPYNQKHDHHICIQSYCPYKCQVQVWNDTLGKITDCGRPCSSDDHDHQLQMDSGECKSFGHTCNKEHPCPNACSEKGNCKVEITRMIVEKEVFETGAGAKFEYESFAEANGGKKRCHQKIPVGLFKHDGDDHKCFSGKASENIHSCDIACDSCGYFCQLKFGHYEESGTFHDCVHGNMRNTRFYAADDVVDTGDGRTYRVGDKGIAEMCNIFCERLGRGHIHLEYCQYALKEEKCVEEEGRRHESIVYKPDEEKAKDEVKHSKFWRRKKWKDPCLDKFKKQFDLCPYICQHISHREKLAQLALEAKTKGKDDDSKGKDDDDNSKGKAAGDDSKGKDGGDDDEEEQESIFCMHKLWHKPTSDHTGHSFECKHPFNNAHIIFLCDRNRSMINNDSGKSSPTLKFISDYKHENDDEVSFNNRLGSLYEGIYKFMKSRIELKCNDKCSAIIFSQKSEIAADHSETNIDFVQNYLLKYNVDAKIDNKSGDDSKENTKVGSNINLYEAFNTTKKVINNEEETIIIITCDASNEDIFDEGAVGIIKELKDKMKKKLSLQCITLNSIKPMDELNKICKAGQGKHTVVKNGMQLMGVYMSIAKQIENVAKNSSIGAFI